MYVRRITLVSHRDLACLRQKSEKNKISSEELLCYWHLPPIARRPSQRAPEHRSNMLCLRERSRTQEREGGGFAPLNIYCVLLSRGAESMNGRNKNQAEKRWPTIYCMPRKPRLIQTARITPPPAPLPSIPPVYLSPLLICMLCVQMHPLIVLSMPGLLSDGLSSHQ